MKIGDKFNKSAFDKDLSNFLNSKYVNDRTLLIDKRLKGFGFIVPRSCELFCIQTKKCLDLLRRETAGYIVLTVGTSFWFPTLGDKVSQTSVSNTRYPALNGIQDARIAEIHCDVNNWMNEGLKIDKYFRIVVLNVNDISNKVTRLARFEKGKEIEEENLKPGEALEEVLHYSNFTGPAQYKAALSAEGIHFDIIRCWAISRAMETHNISFPAAMKKLHNQETLY